MASKVGAFSAVVKDWKCVRVHLESITAEGSASAVAEHLLRKLTGCEFVYTLYFILDHPVILKIVSPFLKEHLFLGIIELHVKNIN